MGPTGLRLDSGKILRHPPKSHKRNFFQEKVKSIAVSFSANKTISKSNVAHVQNKRIRRGQRKLKAFNLSSLSEVLPEVDVSLPQPGASKLKLKCKSRNKLVEREGNQLKAVLRHPAFQLDPTSAIVKHLEYTQPSVVDQVKH